MAALFPPPAPAHSRTAPAGPGLQLHPSHFAFMRALVQGVGLREAWGRYLAPASAVAPDLAGMRALVQGIRDAFAAAARRERRHGIARLVLVDLSRVPDDATALPTLEAFAAERGLEEFSEAEQIEAYQAAHGRAVQRLGRRARLVARQLEALRWLESLSTRPPALDDPVDAWLDPRLAQRLMAAGLVSLRQLALRMQGAAGRWWRPVRGVGARKAARIEQWLQDNAAALGLLAAPSTQAAGTGVASARSTVSPLPGPTDRPLPWGQFQPPPTLDGRHGRFRQPLSRSLLGASTDEEALRAWLGSKAGASTHTQRACRREAERFWLWAVRLRGIALSSVAPADVHAYLQFLRDPQPRADWCGPRHHARSSVLWRPFEGPLSAGARRQTVVILRNLYAFWQQQGHVGQNPWLGAAAAAPRRAALEAERSLTAAQCTWVERRLHRLPDTATTLRLRLAWGLMHGLGLRLSEAVAVQLGDLRSEADAAVPANMPGQPAGPGTRLWLQVPGPGSRGRELPLPPGWVGLLGASLTGRGLRADPLHPAQARLPVLGQAADFGVLAPGLAAGRPVDPRQGIAAATLADQFKRLFRQCAADAQAAGQAADAQALRRASSHWLRHTHGVQALARGLPVSTAQGRLGHASASVTALYRRRADAGQNRPSLSSH